MSSSSPSSSTQGQGLNTVPIRNMKEFLTDTRQYSMPAMNDLRKFNNRVVSNLMYFQTNYMIMSAIIFTLFLLCGFQKLIVGGLVVVPGVLVVLKQLGMTQLLDQIERQYTHSIVAISIVDALSIYFAYNQAWYFVMAIAVPVGFTIGHAAIRKRGIVNVVNNKIEKSSSYSVYDKTPMDIVLKSFGIQSKDYDKE